MDALVAAAAAAAPAVVPAFIPPSPAALRLFKEERRWTCVVFSRRRATRTPPSLDVSAAKPHTVASVVGRYRATGKSRQRFAQREATRDD